MKTLVLASVAAVIAALILAIAVPLLDADSAARPSAHPPSETPSPSELPSPLSGEDADIEVTALIKGEPETLTLHDYLVGVLSAEMPASFEPEALRAQAVAARTYTLYKMLVEPAQSHPEADVCDDITCCKAYASDKDMLEKWGGSLLDTYLSKMERAVSSTDGVCIAYGGEPALAVFHSSSPGMTESSENVWGGAVPYLHAVESPETESDVPDFNTSVSVALTDFKETVLSEYPGASFPDGAPAVSSDAVYSESGRLMSVTVGGVPLSGTRLRALFGLRSAALAISETADAVTLTASGYGHGVGMSQYGANALAIDGWDYREILLHYYDGAELVSAGAFTSR